MSFSSPEFILHFHLSASAGFHRSPTKRQRVETAKPALCQPELTTVKLDLPHDDNQSGVFYYPTCTRVNRCGGCCSHHLLACQGGHSNLYIWTVRVEDIKNLFEKKSVPNRPAVDMQENCGWLVKWTIDKYKGIEPDQAYIKRVHTVWFIRDTVKKRLWPSHKFGGI